MITLACENNDRGKEIVTQDLSVAVNDRSTSTFFSLVSGNLVKETARDVLSFRIDIDQGFTSVPVATRDTSAYGVSAIAAAAYIVQKSRARECFICRVMSRPVS
jgi:hypothetical protein